MKMWIASIVLAATATAARADTPTLLSQQGRLLASDGTPVTGTITMSFALYTSGSGGAALWTEAQTVALDDGYFVAILGAMTALPALDGTPKYLGITAGSDAEMTPREARRVRPARPARQVPPARPARRDRKAVWGRKACPVSRGHRARSARRARPARRARQDRRARRVRRGRKVRRARSARPVPRGQRGPRGRAGSRRP